MGKHRKDGDYYDALRARFAGKPAPASDVSFHLPADPTDRYFGAAPAADEAPAPRLFDPASAADLGPRLGRRIDRHGGAETALLAQALRLGVGFVWLGLAGWFVMNGAALKAGPAALFATIGLAGVGAALFGAILINAAGGASKRAIRRNGAALGARIAEEAQSLSAHMGGRAGGIEAEAFLKSVRFADDGPGADQAFAAYLKRDSRKKPAPVAARVFLIALAAAVCIGAVAALGGTIPSPLSAAPGIMGAVVIGAGLYAAAGLIAALLGAPLRARSEASAERDAMTASIASFKGSRAPAISGLAARLAGDPAGPRHLTNPSLDEGREFESGAAQQTDWRTRDSGPRFVDAGFQAAPKAFRTDACTKKLRS